MSEKSSSLYLEESRTNASSDCEDEKDYRKGGYHPVYLGDIYHNGQYRIIKKLGWGHFSTVWLCYDNISQSHVALKIVKSEQHYTDAAIDEIKLLRCISKSNPSHKGHDHIVQLLNDFVITGPHGDHICMVFEVLGRNLLKLIQEYDYRGIPIEYAKRISKQVLQGLEYLHANCGIIHTDLKPENILICIDDESLKDVPINVKIVDLGNACWINHHFTNNIQTRQYRSPEVIMGKGYDITADIWSCACMIFELVTGDFLFHPKESSRFTKDADHIAQIVELLGHFPSYLKKGRYTKDIFDSKGRIRGIRELNIWPLDNVLIEKYQIDIREAKMLSDLLLPMLHLDPRKRATARECLNSMWLHE